MLEASHTRNSAVRFFRSLMHGVQVPVVMWLLLSSCEIQRAPAPGVPDVLLPVADSVLLPPAPPPPEPMPTFGTTLIHDAFAETSVVGLLTNFLPMVGSLGDYMTMDQSGGPKGGPALRIDWPHDTTCQDDWSGIEHSIPGAPVELYVQFMVRYSPGFLFDWVHTGQGPCTGVAKKLLLIWSADNNNRFDYVMENLTLTAGSDYESATGASRVQNTASPMSPAQYGDGSWHRVTFHIKQSSSATATDGFLYGWIDGVARWVKPRWASGDVGGWVDLKMPSTFNSGSPAAQSEWMTNLTVWKP